MKQRHNIRRRRDLQVEFFFVLREVVAERTRQVYYSSTRDLCTPLRPALISLAHRHREKTARGMHHQ